MDAVEFLTNVNRICSGNGCVDECPLKFFCDRSYDSQTKETIDAAVKAVKEWAKDHTAKTRQSEFLKMFPKADVDAAGVLFISPCKIDKTLHGPLCRPNCSDCRHDYWLQEVE